MNAKLIAASLLVGLICSSNIAKSQVNDQGIGLRVGDPIGITYKSYFNKVNAVEIVLGTTSGNWHGNYYQNSFDNRNKYEGFDYVNHQVDYTVAIQTRLLWHVSFPARVEGRLDWYWGLGGHLRLSKIDYSYYNEEDFLSSDSRTNFDLGPEGILGAEYELLDFPIVGFAEVNLMSELVDNPFRFRFFGAFGVRYAF